MSDVALICHLPRSRRTTLGIARAREIFEETECTIQERVGVRPLHLNPGVPPIMRFGGCLLRSNCKGCKEEPFEDPCGRRDSERPFPKWGFSIALDKFDQAFIENNDENHTFRYKHAEVVEVMTEVISKTPELAPEIWWDRGFGHFVYNLFFEPDAWEGV